MTPSPEIRTVVNQIVDRFKPDKVILFGSHAYGRPTKDSDADILIVMETHKRSIQAAADIAASIDHPTPLDILVKTPAEISARMLSGDSFLSKVLAEGMVLYEARNRRVG